MEKVSILQMETKASGKATASQNFFNGVIKGAVPAFHTIPAKAALEIKPDDYYHILVLFDGIVSAKTKGTTHTLNERLTFVPGPDDDLELKAEEKSRIFELKWKKIKGDEDLIKEWNAEFPYILTYEKSVQYRDLNKSEKTISRIMLEQRHVPRFAMGSVEAIGPDFIKSHTHPMLDQFFVSFPENDMFVVLDGEPYRMKGNEILHIPLGGMHGVSVVENKHCHYLWIDFIVDMSGYDRLDKSHVKTGTWNSIEKAK